METSLDSYGWATSPRRLRARSRIETTPTTAWPDTTGRCRNPPENIRSRAATTLVDGSIVIDGIGLDLARMQARKTEVVTANVKGVEYLFRKHNVAWLKGSARIPAPAMRAVTVCLVLLCGIVSAAQGSMVRMPIPARPTPTSG